MSAVGSGRGVTSRTDRELLAAHLDGDEGAMEELFARHRPTLWKVAYRLLRSPQDAEDLTHESMLRAFRYAATYGGRSTVGAWLRTIVTNACFLHLQRRDRLPLASGDATDLFDRVGPSGRLVEPDQTGLVDLRLALEEAVETLPEVNRLAFYFAVMRGLTEAETAAALGVEVGTVKSRVARARDQLGEELGSIRKNGTSRVPRES